MTPLAGADRGLSSVEVVARRATCQVADCGRLAFPVGVDSPASPPPDVALRMLNPLIP